MLEIYNTLDTIRKTFLVGNKNPQIYEILNNFDQTINIFNVFDSSVEFFSEIKFFHDLTDNRHECSDAAYRHCAQMLDCLELNFFFSGIENSINYPIYNSSNNPMKLNKQLIFKINEFSSYCKLLTKWVIQSKKDGLIQFKLKQ